MENSSEAGCGPEELGWTPLAPTASSVGWKAKQSMKEGKNRRKRKKRTSMSTSTSDSVLGPQEPAEDELHSAGGSLRGHFFDETSLPVGYSWDPAAGRLSMQGKQIQQEIYFQGKAKVILLSGKAELFGYNMKIGEVLEMDCPSWSYSIPLKSREDTVLEIQSLDTSCGTISFKLCNQSEVRPLTISKTWDRGCNQVLGRRTNSQSDKARTLVCGAKAVGKSSMVRFITNRLLSSSCSSVAILDCDVGQPEFSPPGLLTLSIVDRPILSFPHLHMKRPEDHLRSHFFGHLSSRQDPTSYLGMIQDLVQTYCDHVREHYEGNELALPLLVNTDGWVKGFGFEILSTIIERIDPTFIIQLTGESAAKSFDLNPLVLQQSKLISLEAYSLRNAKEKDDSSLPAATLRSLRFCTYFLEGDVTVWDRVSCLAIGISDSNHEIANRLANMPPYVVSMDSVGYEVPGVALDRAKLDVLNGSIVGLLSEDENSDSCCCLGLGIVRAIDRVQRLFYILTPVGHGCLKDVKMLRKGTLELPIECLNRGKYSEGFPYLACKRKVLGLGGEAMKSRNNIVRRRFAD